MAKKCKISIAMSIIAPWEIPIAPYPEKRTIKPPNPVPRTPPRLNVAWLRDITVPLNFGTCSNVRAFAVVKTMAEKVLPRNRAAMESPIFGMLRYAYMDMAARAAGHNIIDFLPKREMSRPLMRVPKIKKIEEPMTRREAWAVDRLNRSLKNDGA